MKVELRDPTNDDLDIFFEQHQDEQALYMAAFTPPDPTDRTALIAHWQRLMVAPDIVYRTIVADGQVAGSLVYFTMFDQPQVGYWLGRTFWGKGIATQALQLFLKLIPERPLYGRTAFDNLGSQRVLQKCGFKLVARDRGYANARKDEIEEYVFRLDG